MKELNEDWRAKLGALLPEDYAATEQEEQKESGQGAGPKYPRQNLHFDIEKKGRGGKTATIISGFTVEDKTVEEIAGILKKKLGVGGSARGGEILIQGDRREEAKTILRQNGIIK